MKVQMTGYPAGPGRRWDIDWLRTMAVMTLFIFLTARIFDTYDTFYVKNSQGSPALTHVLIDTIHPWFMPLFFLLAGASTWFALGFRSGGRYAKERFKRLFIPFIFGLLVIIPPQPYFGLLNHSNYTESFWRYYPHFFKIMPQDLDGYFLGGFTLGHLWFIIYLFIFSLVALPLFLYLRREGGRDLIDWLAAFLARPGMIFLLALPPAAIGLLIRFYPNPLYFIIFFVYGFVLMSDPRFEEALDRYKAVALIIGPLLFLAWRIPVKAWEPELPYWLGVILTLHYKFVTWFTLVAILGYGKKYLNFTNGFLKYAGESSYPFYTLHQTVIVAIGYYVVQWPAGVMVKYLAIIAASFAATTILYDLVIKRTGATRFLFGLKPLQKEAGEKPVSG